ncbi:hypothetical protein MC885_010793 [Smutsia gigantea]|nr:hypothetical protein MC885_010793 [Smutsia gigantea]
MGSLTLHDPHPPAGLTRLLRAGLGKEQELVAKLSRAFQVYIHTGDITEDLLLDLENSKVAVLMASELQEQLKSTSSREDGVAATLDSSQGRHYEAASCTCCLKPLLEADMQGSRASASVFILQVTEDDRAPASEDTAILSAPGSTSKHRHSLLWQPLLLIQLQDTHLLCVLAAADLYAQMHGLPGSPPDCAWDC